MNPITDKFTRPIYDLRISVIDRCNFRCSYCMPSELEHQYKYLNEDKWLSFDEIERLVKIFIQLGVKKVRLTGGEPLLRPNLPELISKLSKYSELDDLALTTNGSLLSKYAKELKSTGLKRLTVSLDTLDSRVFNQMSGGKGNLANVIKGIKKAEEAGFNSIKINVVVQKGVNDHQVLDIIRYFKDTNHIVRFIEYMDVGNCNHWDLKYVVPTVELIERIKPHFDFQKVDSSYFGEVSERFKFADGKGEIGFISSISKPFCQSCTRARISTEGNIYTCLFSDRGFDVSKLINEKKNDEEILEFIKNIWINREDKYSELRSQTSSNQEPSHKVEMFQIGG